MQTNITGDHEEASQGDAIIYCRISSPKQKNKRHLNIPNGLSLLTQEEICREYCENNKLNIISVVHEVVSAREMRRMKKFHELISEMEPNSFLVVSDISRFSRNMRNALETLEELKRKQINIHAVCNNCSYDDQPLNRFQFRSYLNQAELESDQISARVKRSIKNRKKLGSKIGKTQFGFDTYYDKKGIRREKPNFTEQNILLIIKKLKNDDYSLEEIAEFLNENNYNTARWSEWSSERVKRQLKLLKSNIYQKKLVDMMF
jgi:DNA invertase Pin-like site-specific DNA recombinase